MAICLFVDKSKNEFSLAPAVARIDNLGNVAAVHKVFEYGKLLLLSLIHIFRGFSDDPEKHIALPYDMVCAASVDELNFLAARIEQLDPAEIGKLNAALQQKNGFENIGQVIDFTYNVDFYVHIPEVHTYRDLGD